MTIEEAKEVIEQDIPCEYDSDLIDALNMAIKSLEEWEKVKAEIEDEKIDFDINIGMEKYYNNAIDDVLQIIDEHLQEIKNG